MLKRSLRLISLLLLAFFVPSYLVHRFTHSDDIPRSTALHYQYFSDQDYLSSDHRIGGVSHSDSRFAQPLQPEDLRQTLYDLLSTLSSFSAAHNISIWAAHGTLLGWYWNGELLPWDTDIDVQVDIVSLKILATSWNMSSHMGPARSYLLDINPHYRTHSVLDTLNKIDARWIDVSNGKFIDITAVRPNPSGQLLPKDGHVYQNSDIYPLSMSTIFGIPINVPHRPEKILKQEYGKSSITNPHFHW